MAALFDMLSHDREFYDRHLRKWLPDKLFDIHTHVWRRRDRTADPTAASRVVSWPYLVAAENPIEHLIETYELLFPGKDVGALIFASARPEDDLAALNGYVAAACRAHAHFAGLLYARPSWPAAEFEAKIRAGGFLGAKVYLDQTPPYLPRQEIRIFDFLPPHQLDVLDRHGWIAMLHIPRDGRLRDPVNLHQLREIDRRWPHAQVIIAHVGRAYCDGDVGDAFTFLADTRNLLWDFSANTNERVFRQLIEHAGPRRILFGSDLPILRMRMRRIEVDGRYVNLVPPGLYGDVSGDPNMREVNEEEGRRLTFFMYEELAAFRRAADDAGWGRGERLAVFHENAKRVLAQARAG